jgi:hypothetical protein
MAPTGAQPPPIVPSIEEKEKEEPAVPKIPAKRNTIVFRHEDVIPPGYDRKGRKDFKGEIRTWDRAMSWLREKDTNRLFLLTMPNIDKRPFVARGVKLGPIYKGHNLKPNAIPDGRIIMGTLTSEKAISSLPSEFKTVIVSSPTLKKGEDNDDKLEKLREVRNAYGRFYDSKLTLGSVLLPCGALDDLIVEASGAVFKGEVKEENAELELLDQLPEVEPAASSVETDCDQREGGLDHTNQAGSGEVIAKGDGETKDTVCVSGDEEE